MVLLQQESVHSTVQSAVKRLPRLHYPKGDSAKLTLHRFTMQYDCLNMNETYQSLDSIGLGSWTLIILYFIVCGDWATI